MLTTWIHVWNIKWNYRVSRFGTSTSTYWAPLSYHLNFWSNNSIWLHSPCKSVQFPYNLPLNMRSWSCRMAPQNAYQNVKLPLHNQLFCLYAKVIAFRIGIFRYTIFSYHKIFADQTFIVDFIKITISAQSSCFVMKFTDRYSEGIANWTIRL